MIVAVALHEPLAKTQELDRCVVLVKGESFARERVVLCFGLTVCVVNHLQIVGVTLILRLQIHEARFSFLLGLEEDLDELV